MEHFTAIKVIEKLASQINDSQDPKSVLIKFARDNNITPAELERLGQVYNSAKTLSHLEKSANRGDSYDVLDVADLVQEFTKHDNKVEVVKSASTIIRGGRVPNMYVDDVVSLVKEASNEKSEFLEIIAPKLVNLKKEANDRFLREIPNLILELKADIKDTTASIVKKAHYSNTDIGKLINTLILDSAASTSGNMDSISFLAKKAGEFYNAVLPLDFSKAASVKLVSDRTGLLDTMTELQEKIDILSDLNDIVKKADIFTGIPLAPTKDTDETEKLTPPGGDQIDTVEVPQTSEKLPDSVIAYLMAKRDSETAELPEKKEKSDGTGALKDIKALIDSKFENMIVPHLKPETVNRGYTNSKIDKQVSSVQTAATIHELMQDSIISAHSPQKVVGLYNSLAQINPTMMRDKNVAKFALREALQYEGITPHTYGQLVGIEKDKANIEKERLNIRKELYGKV